MVNISTFAAMIFTLTAAFFLPAIVLVVLCAARRVPWKSALAGILTYLVIQYLLRLPLLSLLYRIDAVADFMNTVIGGGLVMGLTAAFFEVGSRWLIGSKLLGRKKELTARDALAYGMGHGLGDAVVVVGASAASNLMLAFSINNNNFLNYITEQSMTQEQAVRIYKVITETPAMQFAASGIERIMMIFVQIAFTFLVFYAIREKNSRYFWMAFGGHFLLNFGITLMSPHGVWMGEGFILLMTLLVLIGCAPLVRRFADMDKILLPTAMPEDGLAEDGSAEDGSTEDGSTEDGLTEDGSTEDGSTEDGLTEDGSTEDGSTEDGSTEDGSTEDGSTEDSSTEDGLTENQQKEEK